MTTKRKQILKAIAVSGSATTGCPSKTNYHRFTLPRNEEATPAALYVRREAGDSACDLYAPVNPVTKFQEDV